MPGRFQSTGRGRGGRGGRGGRYSTGGRTNATNSGTKKKEKKMLFDPIARTHQPDYTFVEVRRGLIEDMGLMKMSNVDDINEAVKTLKDWSEPEPVQGSPEPGTEPAQAAIEQSRLTSTYKIKYGVWTNRKDDYQTNKRAVASKITKTFCSEAMKTKLLQEPDYDTVLDGNPVELLRRIRKWMESSDETDWGPFEMIAHFNRMLSCKQKEGETNAEFRRRLSERTVPVVNLLGDRFMDVLCEKTDGYRELETESQREVYKSNFWELFQASLYLNNCERARYQSLINELNRSYSRKKLPYVQRDLFPPTLHDAVEALNRHVPDNRGKKKWTGRATSTSNAEGAATAGSGNDGTSNAQSSSTGAGTSRRASTRACFCCGDANHILPDCPHTSRPSEQWARPDRYRAPDGRSNSQVEATDNMSIGSSMTHENSQRNSSNMQRDTSDRSGMMPPNRPRSGTSFSQITSRSAEGQNSNPQRSTTNSITGIRNWNLMHYKKPGRGILKSEETSKIRTSDGERLLRAWQAKLSAANAKPHKDKSQDDCSVSTTDSANVQVSIKQDAISSLQNYQLWESRRAGAFPRRTGNVGAYSNLMFLNEGTHMDSGTTFGLRNHEDYGHDVREMDHAFSYGTNVGERSLEYEIKSNHHEDYTCKLDEEAHCNLDSMSEMVALGWRVYMDSDKRNAIIATKDDEEIVYEENHGLYTCKRGSTQLEQDRANRAENNKKQWKEYWAFMMSPDVSDPDKEACEMRLCDGGDCPGIGSSFLRCRECEDGYYTQDLDEEVTKYLVFPYCGVQTVSENIEGFTDRQVQRANKARAAYHMAGAPGMKAFRTSVRSGLFKNFDITEKDVIMAEKIYGPGSSVLKGKTKRPTPKSVLEDWITIPPELTMHNLELDLHIDIVYINNTFGLTAIDSAIRYRHYIPLRSRNEVSLYDAIDKIFRVYNHADFVIKVISCDGEFRCVFDPVKDHMDIHMNYASRGEHDPKSERNNQHVKALFRVQFHRMPFKAIPRVMTEHIAKRVTRVANYYPAKGGLSVHYSPEMILKKRMVDASKEFVAEVGSYVHGYGHDTRSTTDARTIEGIYLGPTDNVQEGHIIFDLNTERVVSRNKIKVLPMSKQVIEIVEALAAREGVTELRTYSKRNGELILDADLLAGVDPDELWDEDYDEENDRDTPTDIDLIQRDYMPDLEELEGLLMEAEDDINDVRDGIGRDRLGTTQVDEVDALYKRIRDRQMREDALDEDFEPYSDYDTDTDHSQSDQENMLDELAEELVDLQRPEEEELVFDEDDDDVDMEDEPEEDEEIANEDGENEVEELSDDVDRPGVRFNTSTSDDEDQQTTHSYDDVGVETKEFSPKRTRSGRSFYSEGIKYRPTERNRRERSRFGQVYLQKNKPKPNLLKNRSAIRRKARRKKIQAALYQAIKKRIDARRVGAESAIDEQKRLVRERLHNIAFQQIGSDRKGEYSSDEAKVIARTMMQIRDNIYCGDGVSYIQQYYLNKGLKIFKERGKDAAMKELDQLIKRSCWTPRRISELKESEKRKAVDAMMLLAEKHTGEVKGRYVFRGNETRDWLSREDTASPTASHEAICCTAVVDAYENRKIMSMDIPNAFIQTLMPETGEGEDRVIMKITGMLVDYMIELDPTYRDYVVYENGKRVVYVEILRAIYGMLQASLLWYRNLRGSLEEYGFVFNRYDPCIANKMVNGKQLTIRFHVDDVLASHMEQEVLEEFFTWVNERYGGLKEVTCTRGRIHTYLGMTLDFTQKGKVKIRMDDYVQRMLEEFPVKFGEDDIQETPAGNNLLEKGKGKELEKEKHEVFHSFVAKSLFVSKRARLDIAPTVAILASRVQKPIQSDWYKLVRMMKYLHSTKKMHLTLSADSLRVIKWHIDASFAVHPDFKSHTGSIMTMGGGAVQSMSRKQKLNSRSSTHAELIGVDDAITQVLWTKLFMEEQGYPIEKNILYQDNMSSILLETNGRSSAGKRSRALNIRYFFVTDQVEQGNVSIEHMSTDDMWADYMTKPLQGEKFRKFRALIQGDQS